MIIKKMELEGLIVKAIYMKGNGYKVNGMDMVDLFIQKEISLMDNGKIIHFMVMELKLTMMDQYKMELGS